MRAIFDLLGGRSGVGPAIALAAVVRLILFAAVLATGGTWADFHANDTPGYVEPARELIATGDFAVGGVPEITRTPGYPLFLIPGIAIGHVELVTILLQIVVSCLTVFLVYRIAELLFGRSETAAVCALLYAVEPLSILYTSKILTETLFTCLVTAFVYWTLRFIRDRAHSQIALAAVLLAAATYVRPVSLFLPWVIVVVLATWSLRTVRRSWLSVIHVGLFLAISIGLIGLWQSRNARQTGFSGFSTISDRGLYFYEAAAVLSHGLGIPLADARERLGHSSYRSEMRQIDMSGSRIADMHRTIRTAAIDTILNHPATYARVRVAGFMKVVLNPGAAHYVLLFGAWRSLDASAVRDSGAGNAGPRPPSTRARLAGLLTNAAAGTILLTLYVLAAWSASSRPFVLPGASAVLLTVAGYLAIIPGGAMAASRFRHPIMPIAAVLAGHGLTLAIAWWRGRRHPTKA